jgi:hypothetical protein
MLNSTFRVYLQAKDNRDGGKSTRFTIGPSIQIQFYMKPLIKLKKVRTFNPDSSKSRLLVLETGTVVSPHRMPRLQIVCWRR